MSDMISAVTLYAIREVRFAVLREDGEEGRLALGRYFDCSLHFAVLEPCSRLPFQVLCGLVSFPSIFFFFFSFSELINCWRYFSFF